MAWETNLKTGGQTRYQVQRLNHRHEQIVNWLVCNPHRNLTECAIYFNYTQAWLTQVVNSDAFQARYRQRCDEVGVATVHTVQSKIAGLSMVVLDRMTDRVVKGEMSDKGMCDTLNLTLKSLGYGGDTPADDKEPAKHLHLHVDAASLTAARELAADAFNGRTEKKLDNHGEGALLMPPVPA